MDRSDLTSGYPRTWAEVREFLSIELVINIEWQAAITVRLFRTAQWAFLTRDRGVSHRVLWKLVTLAERAWFHTVLGADIPAGLHCGPGIRFAHGGRGVVIHPDVRIGADCVLYHHVTLGSRGSIAEVPRIGDGVVLGVGCVVLGDVAIGAHAAVGPNTVVVTDVPAGSHVVAASPVILGGHQDVTTM